MAWAFGRIGNCRLQHPGYLDFTSILHQKPNSGEEKWSRMLKKGDWDG
jgi:hypothetical protein